MTSTRARLGAGLAALSVLVVLACALFGMLPPAPLPADASEDVFSAGRASRHLREITRAPHPVNTPEHERVRGYLVQELQGLGWQVDEQAAWGSVRIAGLRRTAWVKNVCARWAGADHARAVLLGAHYDAVPQSLGAGDDAAGVATLLEVARAVARGDARGEKPARDVILLFSDAEELGLVGAQVFADQHPWARDVAVALNFDGRGSHGSVAMFATSKDNGALIRELARAAPYPQANSLVSTLAQALPNDTDATVFSRAGIPTLSFAHADGLEHYHRRSDSAERYSESTLQHAGSYALALTRRLAFDGAGAWKAPDVAYATFFGRVMVWAPFWLVRLMAMGTLVCVAWALKKARPPLKSMAWGATWAITSLIAMVAAGFAVGYLAKATLEPYFLIERAQAIAVAAMALAASASILLHGAMSRADRNGLANGALLVVIATLVGLAWWQPAAGLSLLGLAFACTLHMISGSTATRLGLRTLGSMAGGVFWLPVIYSVIVAASASAALPAALFLWPLCIPLAIAWCAHTTRSTRWAAAALASAAVVALGVALAHARHDAKSPRVDSLVFAQDLDDRKAYWMSFHPLTAWSERWLAGGSLVPAPQFSPAPDAVHLAPTAPKEATRARVTMNITEGGGERLFAFTVHAPEARCTTVWDEADVITETVSVEGRPVAEIFRFSPERDAEFMRKMTGDRSLPVFRMMFCSPHESHVVVRLRAGEKKPRLRVVQELDGLPAGAVTPRPPEFIPAQASDVTLLSQVESL